ncbi:MAG: hypothetical protein R2755_14160 [Acidimicrobiales bacterium]
MTHATVQPWTAETLAAVARAATGAPVRSPPRPRNRSAIGSRT